MFLVRLDAVNLAFGARKLLRQANLSIEAGERVCLVGRNGAGKTSLLHLVSGELEPDEGEAQIDALLAREQRLVLDPMTPDEIPGIADFVTPAGHLRTLPSHWPHDEPRTAGLDGFFAARLKRVA